MGSLNVRGCSSIESKRSEIGCMFGRRGMDVLGLCETKMKGKGEVAFGEVTGRVSGVERGRAREGVALLLSEWMGNKVVEWKEVSSRLMWVRLGWVENVGLSLVHMGRDVREVRKSGMNFGII